MPRVQAVSRNGAASLLSLLPVLAAAVLAAVVLSPHQPPANSPTLRPPRAGTVAPDFTVTDVRGAVHTLGELKGKAVLLSFLDVPAPADSQQAQPSRAQITFLRSMHTQYAPKGLVVLLVDGSRLRSGTVIDRDSLYNMTFSWNLGDLPVINDDQKESLASRYDVATLPTTFLIDGESRIVERWEGVASTPQLSRRLQELIGLPVVPR